YYFGSPSLYGLGLFIIGDMIGHGGSNRGYNTLMVYYKGYYVSILLNAGEEVMINGAEKTTSANSMILELFDIIEQ
ncbi:MAG: hypothetical protein ABIA67_02250, partial [Candidatus Margulisiibacteriota bacterium]